MDSQRQLKRMQSRKKLAKLVVGLVVIVVLGLAYYYTEGTKGSVENLALVALTKPLSQEQYGALAARLEAYAPEDNREKIALVVYTLPGDGTDDAQLEEMMGRMNDGQPNLYLLEKAVYERVRGKVPLESLVEQYPGEERLWREELFLLKGTPFLNGSGLEEAGDCGLAIQKADSYAVTKDAQASEYYRYQVEIFQNIAGEK